MQEEIDNIINIAGSMFASSPQQIHTMALVVLCGLGIVGVAVSARLNNQLDELSRDVRRLELDLQQLISFLLNLDILAPGSRDSPQEDASSVTPPEGLRI